MAYIAGSVGVAHYGGEEVRHRYDEYEDLEARREWLEKVLGQSMFGPGLEAYDVSIKGVNKRAIRISPVIEGVDDYDISGSPSEAGGQETFDLTSGPTESECIRDAGGNCRGPDRGFSGSAGSLLTTMNEIVMANTLTMHVPPVMEGSCYEVLFNPEFKQAAVTTFGRWPSLGSLLDAPLDWFEGSENLKRVGVSVRDEYLHFQAGWGDGVLTALDVMTVGLRGKRGDDDVGLAGLLSMKVGGLPPSDVFRAVTSNPGLDNRGRVRSERPYAWVGQSMHVYDVRVLLSDYCKFEDAVKFEREYTSRESHAVFLRETGRDFADVRLASNWFEGNYLRIHEEYRRWLCDDISAKSVASLALKEEEDMGDYLALHGVGSMMDLAIKLAKESGAEHVDKGVKLSVLMAYVKDDDKEGFRKFMHGLCLLSDFRLFDQCLDKIATKPTGFDLVKACDPRRSGSLRLPYFQALVSDWFSGRYSLTEAIDLLVRGRSIGNVSKKDVVKCVQNAV